MAWTSFETAVRFFRYHRGQQTDKRIHPTQKPVKLYEWILKNYAEPNQKILDTHLGSGSIAIAIDNVNKIEKMNLSLTACELDTDYFNAAMKRIEQQTAQQTIF
jgi:site-specific DNA-methyltransferase (adenine-specific)